MGVFVADERPGDQTEAVLVDLERLRRLTAYVAAAQRVPAGMEVSVLCVDTAAMTALNAQHMGVDGPTDVLAFPLDQPHEIAPGGPSLLGDVVLCPAVAADQAAERDDSPQDELDLLLVHGILHLLGHDHADADERTAMFDLTDRLLSDFRSQEAAQR